MRIVEEQVKQNIARMFEKSEESELEKAGEGSKGGKVIGHTKSGKPIYDSASHKAHKDFTRDDHADAFELHDKLIISGNLSNEDYNNSVKSRSKHFKMSSDNEVRNVNPMSHYMDIKRNNKRT